MINIIVNSFVCFCVYLQQYSSGLKQYDFTDFCGFEIDEVEKEIARGKKLVSVSLVTRRTLFSLFFLFFLFFLCCLFVVTFSFLSFFTSSLPTGTDSPQTEKRYTQARKNKYGE